MINIQDYDTETLARWACKLNSWEWADDMPDKPADWELMPTFFKKDDPRRGLIKTKYEVIMPYMQLIRSEIGEKEILRWHQVHNLGRTNEYFEQWWKEHHAFVEATSR